MTNPEVGEGIFTFDVRRAQFFPARIEAQEDGAHFGRGLHRQARRAFDAGKILHRRIKHKIQLPGQQRGNPGGGI